MTTPNDDYIEAYGLPDDFECPPIDGNPDYTRYLIELADKINEELMRQTPLTPRLNEAPPTSKE